MEQVMQAFDWLCANWVEALLFTIISPLVIWGLYSQAKMVEDVNHEDRKKGFR